MNDPYADYAQYITPAKNQGLPQQQMKMSPGYEENIDEIKSETDPYADYAQFITAPNKQESQYSPETPGEENVRHLSRSAMRLAELPGTTLGNISELGQKGAEYLKSKIQGEESKKIFQEIERLQKKSGEPKFKLPTSSNLREATSKLTKGYTEPRTENEEHIDEVISTIGGLVGGKMPFLKAVGSAVGSDILGETVGAITGNEKAKDYTKMGGLLVGSFLTKSSPKKFINQLGEELNSVTPEKVYVKNKNLTSKLNKFIDTLEEGLPGEERKAIIQKVKDLEAKVTKNPESIQKLEKKISHLEKAKKSGKNVDNQLRSAKKELSEVPKDSIRLNDLTIGNKDINQDLEKMGYFDVGSQKYRKLSKTGRKQIGELKGILQENIQEYGKKNPKFLDAYNTLNEVYAADAQSRKISDFMKKVLTHPLKYIPGSTPLTLVAYLFPAVIKPALGAAAAAAVWVPPGELMYRIMKSPKLANYYADIVKESAKQNAVGLVRKANKLEKGLEQDLEKNPYHQ